MTMKINEITYNQVENYLNIAEISEEDKDLLENLITIAKNYIMNYTGLTELQLDKYEDLSIVLFILVQNMYDVREYYIDTSNVNIAVTSILDLHSINLL